MVCFIFTTQSSLLHLCLSAVVVTKVPFLFSRVVLGLKVGLAESPSVLYIALEFDDIFVFWFSGILVGFLSNK